MIKGKISKELKRRFTEAIISTIRTGKEHGFLICKDIDDVLIPNRMCVGEECRISFIKIKCPFMTEGNFHTHPDIANNRKIFPEMSEEEIKNFAIDMASYFGKSVPDPGHGDFALLNKLYKNSNGLICIGSDIDINTVSCWSVKEELTKETIDRAIDIIAEEIKKVEVETIEMQNDWINSYFDKEIIDLSNIFI